MDAPSDPADPLLGLYTTTLQTKAIGTRDAYGRILRQFTAWLAHCPGTDGTFQPVQLTATALDTYLKYLEAKGISLSHRARVKTVVGGFARWLIEEQGLLQRNPARAVTLPPQPALAPR